MTSPVLPELVTEGDSLDEAFANTQGALAAVIELYADDGRRLPAGVTLPTSGEVVWSYALVEASERIGRQPTSLLRSVVARFRVAVVELTGSGRT